MSESVGGIFYEVDARTQGLLDAERQVNRSTQKMERSFQRVDHSVQRTNNSLGELKSLVTAVGGALAVQKVIQYADAWTNLQNQLRQVTETESERARVTERLMAIANETRTGISSTANLYARLTRASTELGLSESRRLRITETINKSFATSGATVNEVESAITQLSQGLAAGALRGDEYNSVAEAAPPIMRALAKELNMTKGELREFAAEGGITADIVVRALEGMEEEMDTNFAKAAKSFSQNMTTANNSLTEFIGTSKVVSTAVTASGETIVFFAENLDTVVKIAGLAATVIGVRLVQALTASIAKQALAATGAATLSAAYSTMGARAATATIALRGLRAVMMTLGGPAGLVALAVVAFIEFQDELDGTAQKARELDKEVKDLIGSTEGLTRAQLENKRANLAASLTEARIEAAKLGQEVSNLQRQARSESIRFQGRPGAASAKLNGPTGTSGVKGKLDETLLTIEATSRALSELDAQMEGLGSGGGGSTSTGEQDNDSEKLKKQMDERRQALIQSLETESEQAFREYQERNVAIASLIEEGSARQQELYDRNNADYLAKVQDLKARELEAERAHQENMARLKEEARVAELERMDLFNEQAAQKIVELQKRMTDPLMAMKEELGTMFVNLDQTLSRAFANAIVEGESLKGALHQVGRTITAELLAGLIRVGLQYAINAAIGQSAQAATAAAALGTASTVAAAWAPAAAMASLASFGANAAPANAALAGTTALAQGLAIAGGRQYGGSVMGGSAYRVTEDGKPELLTQGTQQYLIPGKSGKVTANKDMGGSGEVDVSVQIVNNGTAKTADAKMQRLSDRKFVIQVMQDDLQSGNPTSYSTQFASRYGMTRKGN